MEMIKKIILSINGYYLFLLLTIASLLCLAFTISRIGRSLIFDVSTGMYYYSSLIQANAAIISIFGVFYIFRLQSIQSAISEIYDSLCRINTNIQNSARSFRQMTFEQKKIKIASYREDNEIVFEYKKWFKYESIIDDTKTNLKKADINYTYTYFITNILPDI